VHGSDVVDGGSQSTDFVLQDETGGIVVRHSGAGWTAMTTFDRTVGRGDPLYGSKAPERTVRGSTGRRTFHESAVPVGVKAWIMGNAHVGPSGDALEIGSGGEEGVFLVSLTGEASHGSGARVLAVLAWIVACGAAVAGGLGLAPLVIAMTGIPEGPAVAVGLGFGILSWTMASTLTWAFMVRNGAVRVRQRWERAASLVDVELKRRADLIPGLVTVTRAAAAHEALVQRAVAELRAGAASHGILRVLAERYPALTADAAFLRLQRELAETEARIAQSRTFEIQSRERLLERLQTFPEGLVAAVMGVAKPPPALDAPAPPPSSPARPPRG
jgi:LemA protein